MGIKMQSNYYQEANVYFLKRAIISALVVSFTLAAGAALAQAPVVGATKEQAITASKGWSISKDIMKKDVFTDGKEKLGSIEDIIVTPNDGLSYVVVSTGGLLGMVKHDIIVPLNQLKVVDSRFILPGATKETVKAMPEFKHEK
jgi:hypothetical protein